MKKALSVFLSVVTAIALVFGIISTENGNNMKKDLEQVTELESLQAVKPERHAKAERATEPKQLTEVGQAAAMAGSPGLKYVTQGQEAVFTISVIPGDALLAMAGDNEQINTAIRDLFEALGIQVKAQTTDKQVQGGLDVLLNGESVTGITVAANSEAVYCSSNLLGDGIYAFTIEELNKLAETYMQQAGQKNSQMAAIMNMLKGLFSGDPRESGAVLAQMLGAMDLTKLNEALVKLVANMESLEVTEAPGRMPDAVNHARITMKKEDLRKVMTEAGKVIWNIPAVQQMLKQKNMGSEKKITEAMASAVDKLQEDVVIDLYLNNNQAVLTQVNTSVVKAEGENARPVSAEILFVPKTEGSSVEGDIVVKNGETSDTLSFNAGKAGNEINGIADWTFEDQEGKWQKATVTLKSVANRTESSGDTIVDLTLSVWPTRDGQPMAVTFKEMLSEQDLGDHAEGNFNAKISIEGMGDLLTVNCDARTGLAEAYIITGDAVRPLTMSQKEQSKWIEGLQSNAQQILLGALSKLPASVIQLFIGTGN